MSEETKRYSYSTVGYGIFSLLGQKYRMGRIEIFDEKDESGYAIDEGTYCIPFKAAALFEDFMDALETDLPIQISMGSVDNCIRACEIELGVEEGKLNDQETIKKYYEDKI